MRRRISYLLVITTALLALLPALSMADPVGRLFFTPEQRHALDEQRNSGGIKAEGAPPQAGEITLNGIVKRSGGKSTVWINRVVQNETDLEPGPKAQASQAHLPNIPVNVPGMGKTINLKVGQTLDISNGKIREGYQPAIVIDPPSITENTSPSSV